MEETFKHGANVDIRSGFDVLGEHLNPFTAQLIMRILDQVHSGSGASMGRVDKENVLVGAERTGVMEVWVDEHCQVANESTPIRGGRSQAGGIHTKATRGFDPSVSVPIG